MSRSIIESRRCPRQIGPAWLLNVCQPSPSGPLCLTTSTGSEFSTNPTDAKIPHIPQTLLKRLCRIIRQQQQSTLCSTSADRTKIRHGREVQDCQYRNNPHPLYQLERHHLANRL